MLLGAPDIVGPWLVITTGIWFGAFAVHIVMDASSFYARGEPLTGNELRSVPEEQIREEKPFAVMVPILVTGSWVLILAGLIWLAFVDWRIAVATVVVGVVLILSWGRRARRRKAAA